MKGYIEFVPVAQKRPVRVRVDAIDVIGSKDDGSTVIYVKAYGCLEFGGTVDELEAAISAAGVVQAAKAAKAQ